MTTAAFFRLERALVPHAASHAAAYIGANAPRIRQRALSLGVLGLARGLAIADPGVARRIAWATLAGLSRDRVEVMAGDYVRDELLPAIRPRARELLDAARAEGRRIVLLSEMIGEIARPLGRELGADEVLANTLEWDGEDATGRLVDPVFGAELDPRVLRAIAERLGVDLARSHAYGASAADVLLLSQVGFPCAVEPDRQLSRIARELDWPVIAGGAA